MSKEKPNGIFVTAFDKNMNGRECLGKWFDNNNSNNNNSNNNNSNNSNLNLNWFQKIEDELVNKVIHLAKTTSRLSSGHNLDIPVTNYTITYLYKDIKHNFIRGWHGILHNAFYLSDVFLENTFNNGKWIKNNDTQWQSNNKFNLSETFKKLNIKAGISIHLPILKKTMKKNKKPLKVYTLYSSHVIHYKINF